jgi:hypothetical protein
MWPASLCYEARGLICKYNIYYGVTQKFKRLGKLIIEIFKSTGPNNQSKITVLALYQKIWTPMFHNKNK